MNKYLKRVAMLMLTTLPIANAVADRIILDLDFAQNGVLPSTTAGISYVTVGTAIDEPDVFSTSGGLLVQEEFSLNGRALYQSLFSPIPLDPGLDLVVETRMRVNRINEQAGAWIDVFDSINSYAISWQPGGLCLGMGVNTGGSPCPFEFSVDLDTSIFHDYRLESPGASSGFSIFVDNQLLFAGDALTQGFQGNGFNFGNGNFSDGGADADWDFIRIRQRNALSVPEPNSLALFSLGLLGMALTKPRSKF